MKTKLINFKDDRHKNINIKLSMMEIKMLHNACVNILTKHPEMIGYDIIRLQLEKTITNN